MEQDLFINVLNKKPAIVFAGFFLSRHFIIMLHTYIRKKFLQRRILMSKENQNTEKICKKNAKLSLTITTILFVAFFSSLVFLSNSLTERFSEYNNDVLIAETTAVPSSDLTQVK
jgi:hypothetical protein